MPTSYAANIPENGYRLKGSGFTLIPSNAVGVLAISNNHPLEFKNTTVPYQMYTIVVESDTYMECIPKQREAHGQPVYLGAILSEDRTEVIWVNETQPLP